MLPWMIRVVTAERAASRVAARHSALARARSVRFTGNAADAAMRPPRQARSLS
jgi:hypothetical protein